MKDQDRYFKEILGTYTVTPADETDIQKTILAGKQLLMKNPVQELRWYRRIVNQFKYISPLLWFSQLLAIGICMLLISQISSDTDMTAILSAISFIVASLGVVGFPEVCKSFSYQMWELEQSCKYNLRQITALRLSVIGTFHLILVLVIALATSMQMSLPLWEIALYLLVPFNLSCIAAFFVLGFFRNRGKERLILPAGLGVAFFLFIATNRFSLYDRFAISVWTVAFLVTTVILINRIFHFLNRLEQGGAALCS